MGEKTSGFRGLLRGGAAIAVAMGVMNVASYGYTVVGAHLLGPEPFGAFSALMGVVLVVSVVSLGLQATGARRIAADPEHVVRIERVVLGVSYRAALALGLLCLALAPLLNELLRLHSLASAALVALTAAPLTIMGGQAGVLQGERRWGPLALVYLAQGLGRVAVGVALMVVWPTELSAMLGVALGAWVPVLIGWLALRRPREPASVPPRGHSGTELLREAAGSSQALLAFFALANSDIVLARAVLDSDLAGLYAAGLILVKAILFLPQFVVVIAFPSMASPGASHGTLTKSLLLAATMGMCGLLGVLLLPDLALVFVGGSEFAEIRDELWLFAIVGTLLSMVQLLLYSVLARQQLRAVLMIWTALVVLVLLASGLHSVEALVTLVCLLDGALLLALLGNAWLTRPGTRQRTRSTVVEQPGASEGRGRGGRVETR